MSLNELFGKVVEQEGLGTENQESEMYQTGIDLFDYMNGMKRPSGDLGLGLPAGRMTMFIGNSGTAKSSIAIQQSCNIAKRYDNASIFHYDFERSTSRERILQLSGWSEEEFDQKYFHFTRDISSESIYVAVKAIEKVKMDNYDKYKLDTGRKDHKGNPIYELPPTIIIIDSIAVMAPKEVEEDDELVGNMGKL